MELTRREYEIARMVAAGKSNHAIATVFGISARTIDLRLQSIYQKLQITSPAQLALLVLRHERGGLKPLG